MLHLVALVRTEVCEGLSASIIRVTRIYKVGTTLAVTSNRRMLRASTTSLYISSCHPVDGSAKFLRNAGYYKSHTALHPIRRHTS
jgi:hypothetical protein